MILLQFLFQIIYPLMVLSFSSLMSMVVVTTLLFLLFLWKCGNVPCLFTIFVFGPFLSFVSLLGIIRLPYSLPNSEYYSFIRIIILSIELIKYHHHLQYYSFIKQFRYFMILTYSYLFCSLLCLMGVLSRSQLLILPYHLQIH